ncbi:hypothetical protein ACMHYC_08165 [Acinetobacter courvalinii]|uniref:hypothetical protein n=1 Tax=Acinetobacter courvalinii TaxID=280147 RepID=UPI0039C9AEF9
MNYLLLAEKIYKKLNKKSQMTMDSTEYVNYLLKEVREEIKGTGMKLICNYVETRTCFKNNKEGKYPIIDISLMPNYKNYGEFVLWLAIFIEKNTKGGKVKITPIVDYVPENFTYHKSRDEENFFSNKKICKNLFRKENENFSNEIINYFESLEESEERK